MLDLFAAGVFWRLLHPAIIQFALVKLAYSVATRGEGGFEELEREVQIEVMMGKGREQNVVGRRRLGRATCAFICNCVSDACRTFILHENLEAMGLVGFKTKVLRQVARAWNG